jgi:hypothetical protein
METQQTPFGFVQASVQTWFKATGSSLETMEPEVQAISKDFQFYKVSWGQTGKESVPPIS